MSVFHLWLGLERVIVQFDSSEFTGGIIKVCCVKQTAFLLTKYQSLFYGTVEEEQNNSPVLCLRKSSIKAIDIASNSNSLYFVNENGQVFKTSPLDLNAHEEIFLKEESRCCSHGYKTPEHTVKVTKVAVTETSCLFVTESGQLWASGDQKQISIQGNEPKPVLFFDKRVVKAVSCGSDFSVVLVNPSFSISDKEDSDDEANNEENCDVFVSNCPICVTEYISSPISMPSTSDTCPLGLHIHQTNTHNSSTSTASKDNTAEDRKSSDESSSVSVVEELAQKEIKSNSESVPDDTKLSSKNEEETHATGRKVRENGEDIEKENEVAESPKTTERRNEFFINTDAARQFLTRQLSWVSSYGGAGEELLVECAEASLVRPSRIVKQNISNMANLVYEGVKTVGDRVVTLSRHMSGGSETSDNMPGLTDYESFEDLCNSEDITSSMQVTPSERIEDANSPAASERADSSEANGTGANSHVALPHIGAALLACELWAWGAVERGQLGTGDTARRTRPVLVRRLQSCGVCRVSCGRAHASVLTLDGRAFTWGAGQAGLGAAAGQAQQDQSSPREVVLPNGLRSRDVAAGGSHTLVLGADGNLYCYSSQMGVLGALTPLEIHKDISEEQPCKVEQMAIFASRGLSLCEVSVNVMPPLLQDLSSEQAFLEEALLVHTGVVRSLQKRGGPAQEGTAYERLCTTYRDLVSMTAVSVHSLWECTDGCGDPANVLSVVRYVDEYVRAYRNYLAVLCDVISISGFVHIAKLVDIPARLTSMFAERSIAKKNRKCPEAVLAAAFCSPMNRPGVYRVLVQSILRSGGSDLEVEKERRLREALNKWEHAHEEQERRRREAETTRAFWESSGRLADMLRAPQRRLLRESHAHPVAVLNSGRFSSHWLVLLSDALVHATGSGASTCTTHPLTTIWIEALQDTDTLQNAITLTMPEETLTLYTPSASEKKEWVQALQGAIKKSLQKPHCHQPPALRTACFTFTKHPMYKDAKYTGRWCNGKLQGAGRMVWPDGRVYIGEFQNNMMHGYGCLETPGVSTYEGVWKEGHQNGLGVIKYACGDVYEGHFKDGLPHGHGVLKQGHFTASVASVYIGEWVAGVKQGYGVMDDIVTGEKYLGCWSNNLKHGCGLIVTLDGIYYEGVFMQDVLTGHGVMVFEDGTHYEGEFRSAGVFSGKGTLTFSSGDQLEGSLSGAWNEGVKVTGTLHKVTAPPTQLRSKPQSFGKLCVAADQKWKAIFRQCYQQLGVAETVVKPGSVPPRSPSDVQKIWEHVAVFITYSRQEALRRSRMVGRSVDEPTNDSLDTIPQFARDKLDKTTFQELRKYLAKAFESTHHPLGALLADVAAAYTATYGGVRVHPLLLSHAVAELHSITGRVYEVVRLLFPALPPLGHELVLDETKESDPVDPGDEFDADTSIVCGRTEGEIVSAAALLHPALLPRVHSALFVLYALHNKAEDDAYWRRLLKWNRQPDTTLMAFLGIDQKFWIKYASPKSPQGGMDPLHALSPLREQRFHEAVETLQQLKTTFSPLEKLLVIRSTFEQMTRAVQQELGAKYLWTMDDLFPVFHFVVVRSQILQLGSEIHFIEDFMEPYLQNGELGIMFTTLKACYYQILQEKVSMSS